MEVSGQLHARAALPSVYIDISFFFGKNILLSSLFSNTLSLHSSFEIYIKGVIKGDCLFTLVPRSPIFLP
jgi:hypothetical protein